MQKYLQLNENRKLERTESLTCPLVWLSRRGAGWGAEGKVVGFGGTTVFVCGLGAVCVRCDVRRGAD